MIFLDIDVETTTIDDEGITGTSIAYTDATEITEEPEELEGPDHPCYRKCESGKNMVCRYNFELEWYEAMSKACFNCPFNVTDCDRKDCIPADGIGRPLTVVNRKMPGPRVEVS